jgi:hypothetical protein
VLSFCERRGSVAYWNCRCKCGFEKAVAGTTLSNGSSTRCKQCSMEKINQNPDKRQRMRILALAKSRRNPFHVMWKQAQSKLRRGKRILELKVSVKHITEVFYAQKQRCALSGRSIGFAQDFYEHAHGGTTASLDRIDSSKGYVEGNIQWIHKDFQFMKSSLDQNEFIAMCVEVVNHQKQID